MRGNVFRGSDTMNQPDQSKTTNAQCKIIMFQDRNNTLKAGVGSWGFSSWLDFSCCFALEVSVETKLNLNKGARLKQFLSSFRWSSKSSRSRARYPWTTPSMRRSSWCWTPPWANWTPRPWPTATTFAPPSTLSSTLRCASAPCDWTGMCFDIRDRDSNHGFFFTPLRLSTPFPS